MSQYLEYLKFDDALCTMSVDTDNVSKVKFILPASSISTYYQADKKIIAMPFEIMSKEFTDLGDYANYKIELEVSNDLYDESKLDGCSDYFIYSIAKLYTGFLLSGN